MWALCLFTQLFPKIKSKPSLVNHQFNNQTRYLRLVWSNFHMHIDGALHFNFRSISQCQRQSANITIPQHLGKYIYKHSMQCRPLALHGRARGSIGSAAATPLQAQVRMERWSSDFTTCTIRQKERSHDSIETCSMAGTKLQPRPWERRRNTSQDPHQDKQQNQPKQLLRQQRWVKREVFARQNPTNWRATWTSSLGNCTWKSHSFMRECVWYTVHRVFLTGTNHQDEPEIIDISPLRIDTRSGRKRQTESPLHVIQLRWKIMWCIT